MYYVFIIGGSQNMNDLVVKHNALTNASYSLSLAEQRLILLAIVDARCSGHGVTTNDPLTITAKAYENQFSVHRNTAYQALKDASSNLFDRRFSYQELNKRGSIENVRSRWVSEIRYVDDEASVKLIFAPAVVPLITELERHFTQYELGQVAGLSSAYSVRLYELLISWRSIGKTPIFELEEFRNKLGVIDGEYKLMHQFKQRVLDLAISQINEHTDINASYEQHKHGRTITGFSFKFKLKTPEPKLPKQEKPKQNATHTKLQEEKEKAADLAHLKKMAELAGIPLETLLKRP
jgi:plasmid replication initiation protein